MSKFEALVKRKQHKTEPVAAAADYVPQGQAPKKIGRPAGKRSNPDYEQVTSYIRRDTYQAVQVALIQSGKKRQYSELVQELLQKWLEGEDRNT